MAYPQDLIRVSVNWTLPNGASAANVLHVARQDGAEATALDAQETAEQVRNWWDDASIPTGFDSIREIVDDACVCQSVHAVCIGATPPAEYTAPVGDAGSYNGTPLPAETAMVATLYTAFSGRSYRGRIFLPGMVANNIVANASWDTGAMDIVRDAFIKLMNQLDTPSVTPGSTALELVVYSAKLNTHERVTSVVPRATPHHISGRNG